MQKPWIHLLTASQDQAVNVLHGAPKVAMYKETTGATKDQGVVVGYCVKLKSQTIMVSCRRLPLPLDR